MMKIIKFSLAILVILVLALLAIPMFLDVDDYRTTIEQEVEDATGRSLHIGSLSVSLFPWVGVTLKDVEFANRAGFSEQAFMKVKYLDVQVELLPLLNKTVTIKRFELNAPEILLEKNAKGQGNWQDLAGSTSAQGDAGQASATSNKTAATTQQANEQVESPILAALSAESLRIADARFIWRDAQSKQNFEFSNIQLVLDDVQLERPIDISLSLGMGQDTLHIEGKVGPLGDVAKLDVNKLPVQLHISSKQLALLNFASVMPELPALLGSVQSAKAVLDVQVEQRADGVRMLAGSAGLHDAMKLDADWKIELTSADKANLKHLDVQIDDQHILKAEGSIKGLSANKVSYEMRVQTDALQRTWLANYVSDLNSMYAAHPAPWQSLSVGALLAGDATTLDIRDMQLKLNKEVLQVSGRVGFAAAPDIRLRLAAKNLHLDPWLPQPKEEKKAADTKAPASTTGDKKAATNSSEPDLRFLKPWRVNVQAQIADLAMRGLNFTQFSTTISGHKGLFKLDPMRFQLSGGQVEEKATLNAARYPAAWTESIHISNVKLGPLLKIVADTDMLDGTMKLDTDLKAVGLLPERSTKSLNGTAQLSMTDGRIKGFDIAGALRNIGSLGKNKGNQYTDFAQLQASFRIRNGVATNNDMFMASPLFRLTGKGIINLVTQSLDYHVKPKLIGSLVGQGDTVTARKGITIPLHIKGPFAAPSIKPEMDAKSLIDTVGALKGAGKPKDMLRNLGKSLLGGGAAQPAAPAGKQPAQQQPKQQPAIPKPVDALKGLLQGF